MEPYLRLEKEWGEFTGYPPKKVVVCATGTAALHLVLAALRERHRKYDHVSSKPLAKGRTKVIVPDYSMISCARAVTLAGLQPVFIDCDASNALLDESLVLGRMEAGSMVGDGGSLSVDIGAIMAVHTYGRTCKMGYLSHLAGHYGAYLIEDLAEAHGVTPHPDSDAACWSFYKNKIIAGEEGGAIAFKDEGVADIARTLRSMGLIHLDYRAIPGGMSYRLSNAHSLLILEGLRKYIAGYRWKPTREEIVSYYEEHCPPSWKMPEREAPWVYDIRIPGLNREKMLGMVRLLNEEGIAARPGFYPCSLQEEYAGRCEEVKPSSPPWGYAEGPHRDYSTNSIRLSHEILYLPINPEEKLPSDREGDTTLLSTYKESRTFHKERAAKAFSLLLS